MIQKKPLKSRFVHHLNNNLFSQSFVPINFIEESNIISQRFFQIFLKKKIDSFSTPESSFISFSKLKKNFRKIFASLSGRNLPNMFSAQKKTFQDSELSTLEFRKNFWKSQLPYFCYFSNFVILCDIFVHSHFVSDEETWKVSFEGRILERKFLRVFWKKIIFHFFVFEKISRKEREKISLQGFLGKMIKFQKSGTSGKIKTIPNPEKFSKLKALNLWIYLQNLFGRKKIYSLPEQSRVSPKCMKTSVLDNILEWSIVFCPKLL